MKLDSFIDTLRQRMKILVDKKHTGLVTIELHMSQGSVGKMYMNVRMELKDSATDPGYRETF